MAEVTKDTTASLATPDLNFAHKISELKCGENVAAGDLCYIKGADNKLYRSNGTALNEAAQVAGMAMGSANAAQGDALTVAWGCMFQYATGQPPGTRLFASAATPGGFSTTATTGGTLPVAMVVDAKRVFVFGPH